jgi:phosphotransferase system enzyme I (PtsI)
VETPSAVCLIDELAKESDFFSIGSNDLLQYTVVADRGNRAVTHPHDRWHPALWRQMATIIRAGHRARIPVAICGEIATDPQVVPVLLGMGIDSLSCHPNSVPKIKSIVRSIRRSDARTFSDRFMRSSTLDQARQLALGFARRYGIKS